MYLLLLLLLLTTKTTIILVNNITLLVPHMAFTRDSLILYIDEVIKCPREWRLLRGGLLIIMVGTVWRECHQTHENHPNLKVPPTFCGTQYSNILPSINTLLREVTAMQWNLSRYLFNLTFNKFLFTITASRKARKRPPAGMWAGIKNNNNKKIYIYILYSSVFSVQTQDRRSSESTQHTVWGVNNQDQQLSHLQVGHSPLTDVFHY